VKRKGDVMALQLAYTLRIWAGCLFLAAAAVTQHANAETDGVAAQGREKSRVCEGCHGLADYNNAFPEVYRVPKLGDQQSAYIVKALQDYKSGARRHSTMRSIAAALTDQDMADLAAYYSAPTGR
jgi:cytochrome c553